MKDRFNLENEISTLYTFSDQLSLLSEGILEHDLDTDQVVNVLEGLKVLVNLQTQKLHDTMSQCFKLDQYSNTERGNN
jgi:hypothetical protein